MPLQPWKTLSRAVRVKNPWWTYYLDTFALPSGATGEYHSVHTNGSSMILPLLPDGTVLLVNQYRYLARRESLEFPCGSVKDGSDHEETARHELQEETGHRAARLRLVGEFNPYNGVTDEFCRVFLAEGLDEVGGTPDVTEEFELVSLLPAEIDQRIATGEIWDGMSIAAWCLARAHVNPHSALPTRGATP